MYDVNFMPDSYKCSVTGKTGVQLWRQYNTFADYIELLCEEEALKDQGLSCRKERSEMIGGLVPAVPVDGSYWGFSSVPLDGCLWFAWLGGQYKLKECLETHKYYIDKYPENYAPKDIDSYSYWLNVFLKQELASKHTGV